MYVKKNVICWNFIYLFISSNSQLFTFENSKKQHCKSKLIEKYISISQIWHLYHQLKLKLYIYILFKPDYQIFSKIKTYLLLKRISPINP